MGVVRHATIFGAYTTSYPAETVVASADPLNSGLASLEVMYHEATHLVVAPDEGTVGRAIAAASRTKRQGEPEGLWHAVIFFTSGAVVSEAYRRAGQGKYVPYAKRAGLYTDGSSLALLCTHALKRRSRRSEIVNA